MAKANGGSRWERTFAKQLSLWWTGGENQDVFWRSIGSGGRATRRKGSRLHHGDIALIDPIGKPLMDLVVIEVKCGYRLATIHDLLDRSANAKEQIYEEWFRKVEVGRKRAEVYAWMVVHLRKRREAVVWLPGSLYDRFVKAGAFFGEELPIIRYGSMAPVGGAYTVIGIWLKGFFAGVTPNHVRKVLKEINS